MKLIVCVLLAVAFNLPQVNAETRTYVDEFKSHTFNLSCESDVGRSAISIRVDIGKNLSLGSVFGELVDPSNGLTRRVNSHFHHINLRSAGGVIYILNGYDATTSLALRQV